MSDQLSVAIIYGLAEGGYHSRRLRRQLTANGFTTVKNPEEADIIIAHSAGCYLVPDGKAKVVLHSGYTYWPGRRLSDSLRALLAAEYRMYGPLRWFWRRTVNEVYLLKLRHIVEMYHGWHDPGAFLDQAHTARQIFIRNRDDSYCDAEALMERSGAAHTYISLPGTHNHIWDEPEQYINLLKSVT